MATQPASNQAAAGAHHPQARYCDLVVVDPFTSYSNYLFSSSYQQQRQRRFLSHNSNQIMDGGGRPSHHYVSSSTEELIRMAGARFLIRSSSSSSSSPDMSAGNDEVPLSEEAMKMVGLVESLLAASDKVAREDYGQAATHLSECRRSSSDVGNVIQRLVFYFSEALQERINLRTGRSSLSSSSSSSSSSSQIQRMASCLPMGIVSQFAGVQAIVDQVIGAERVHVVDLSIRNGVQWTILMSALASSSSSSCSSRSPPQLLKLTAVGTNEDSRQTMEQTGRRLASFAETLNLPFSFHVVMVSELSDLKVHMLDFHVDDDDEEAVAVYLEYVPRKLIRSVPDFDKLMIVIKSIDPNVMVVSEVEANHNSPGFGYRFMEALFFFNAYFDAIDVCVEQGDDDDDGGERRMAMEATCCGESIRNMVACEGDERVVRNVPLRAWRLFFGRFGMVEVEMSTSCFEQARDVAESVGCGSMCTVEVDEGKSLVVGWKGTRLHSVSAWKFMS